MQNIIVAFALSLLFFQSSGQGPKTDREFDELNGPVRFVRVEMEDYRDQPGFDHHETERIRKDAAKTNTRFLEKIVAYDSSGRVTEEINGSGTDCVSSRHVFSYDAEGSRTEAVYSGDSLVGGGKSETSVPPVSPLIRKHVFKTDGAGRRSEIDEYDGAGKLSGKSLYKYDKKGRLNELIQENDSIRSRCEFKYHDNGPPSEKTCQYWDFGASDRSQYAYEYDAKGNWIKRTAKNSTVLSFTSVGAGIRIHYREIEYFAAKEDQAQSEEPGDRFDAAKLAPCPAMIIYKADNTFKGSSVRRVVPRYPPDAKKARITGSVVVEVTVDETGMVISARTISGPAELRGVSEGAARGWRFRPTMLLGARVKVVGTLTFHF